MVMLERSAPPCKGSCYYRATGHLWARSSPRTGLDWLSECFFNIPTQMLLFRTQKVSHENPDFSFS